MIRKGDVKNAKNVLGRHYQVRGKVVSGRNRGGKLLGFPTANITLKDELCPETGVYAVTVECSKGFFNGVANIGYSPTFDDHLFTVEVHILDFHYDIYGEDIRVNMIEKLRNEKKFNGIGELSEQIGKDIDKARKILENVSKD
jgi:riboflavin kinase/FMN adenylyltransferase